MFLFHDLLSSHISHYSVRNVISTHKLTPLKQDQLMITGHADHSWQSLVTIGQVTYENRRQEKEEEEEINISGKT